MFNFANKMLNALVGNEDMPAQANVRPQSHPRPHQPGPWNAHSGTTPMIPNVRHPNDNIRLFQPNAPSDTSSMPFGQIRPQTFTNAVRPNEFSNQEINSTQNHRMPTSSPIRPKQPVIRPNARPGGPGGPGVLGGPGPGYRMLHNNPRGNMGQGGPPRPMMGPRPFGIGGPGARFARPGLHPQRMPPSSGPPMGRGGMRPAVGPNTPEQLIRNRPLSDTHTGGNALQPSIPGVTPVSQITEENVPSDVDLTQLSVEERKIIENVMAKAQQMDTPFAAQQKQEHPNQTSSTEFPSHQTLTKICASCKTQIPVNAEQHTCGECKENICRNCIIQPPNANQISMKMCKNCLQNKYWHSHDPTQQHQLHQQQKQQMHPSQQQQMHPSQQQQIHSSQQQPQPHTSQQQMHPTQQAQQQMHPSQQQQTHLQQQQQIHPAQQQQMHPPQQQQQMHPSQQQQMHSSQQQQLHPSQQHHDQNNWQGGGMYNDAGMKVNGENQTKDYGQFSKDAMHAVQNTKNISNVSEINGPEAVTSEYQGSANTEREYLQKPASVHLPSSSLVPNGSKNMSNPVGFINRISSPFGVENLPIARSTDAKTSQGECSSTDNIQTPTDNIKDKSKKELDAIVEGNRKVLIETTQRKKEPIEDTRKTDKVNPLTKADWDVTTDDFKKYFAFLNQEKNKLSETKNLAPTHTSTNQLAQMKSLGTKGAITTTTQSIDKPCDSYSTEPYPHPRIYNHCPGEVYTIQEEEGEIGSPTASDGVSKLRCPHNHNFGSQPRPDLNNYPSTQQRNQIYGSYPTNENPPGHNVVHNDASRQVHDKNASESFPHDSLHEYNTRKFPHGTTPHNVPNDNQIRNQQIPPKAMQYNPLNPPNQPMVHQNRPRQETPHQNTQRSNQNQSELYQQKFGNMVRNIASESVPHHMVDDENYMKYEPMQNVYNQPQETLNGPQQPGFHKPPIANENIRNNVDASNAYYGNTDIISADGMNRNMPATNPAVSHHEYGQNPCQQTQQKSSITGMLSDFTKALGLGGSTAKEDQRYMGSHHQGVNQNQYSQPTQSSHAHPQTLQNQPIHSQQNYGSHMLPQQVSGPHMPPQQVSGPHMPPQQVSGPHMPPQQVSGPHMPPQQVSGPHMPPQQVSGPHMPPQQVSGPHMPPQQISGPQNLQQVQNSNFQQPQTTIYQDPQAFSVQQPQGSSFPHSQSSNFQQIQGSFVQPPQAPQHTQNSNLQPQSSSSQYPQISHPQYSKGAQINATVGTVVSQNQMNPQVILTQTSQIDKTNQPMQQILQQKLLGRSEDPKQTQQLQNCTEPQYVAMASLPLTGQVICSGGLPNAPVQPIIIQPVANPQQLQQIQMQQSQQLMNNKLNQDAINPISNQIYQQTQGKVVRNPQLVCLKDYSTESSVDSRKLQKPVSSLPTAALLSKSTITTSDARYKSSPFTPSETSLSSLQRARIGSSASAMSPHEDLQIDSSMVLPSFASACNIRPETPRGFRDDSSDTMSEADSSKSSKLRRRLPILPPNPDSVFPSLRSSKYVTNSTKDRVRSQIARHSSLDGSQSGSSWPTSIFGHTRSSASMTNLNNISKVSDLNLPDRPGSALGLLRSRAASTNFPGPRLKSGLPSCIANLLPSDLHHLIYTKSANSSPPLPKNYVDIVHGTYDRKSQLEAELHKLQEERRRSQSKDRTGDILRHSDMDSSLPHTSFLHNNQRHNRKKGHRRQLSDSKIFPSTSFSSEGSLLSKSVKSLLQKTDNSLLSHYDDENFNFSSGRSSYRTRRNSEGLLGIDFLGRSSPLNDSSFDNSLSAFSKQKTSRKHRKPRSWHPSPYASDDDDDDMFSREEKKKRIKAEIARRRQQIEENSKLHEELLRLAKLRESAEMGVYDPYKGSYDLSPTQSPSTRHSTSVLRSIEDILKEARDPSMGYYLHGYNIEPPKGRHMLSDIGSRASPRNYYPYRSTSSRYPMTEEDISIARLASTFQGDPSIENVYEKLSNLSSLSRTINSVSDHTPAMPLLPDMPTKSRKLLENLGSSPLSSRLQRSKYDSQTFLRNQAQLCSD